MAALCPLHFHDSNPPTLPLVSHGRLKAQFRSHHASFAFHYSTILTSTPKLQARKQILFHVGEISATLPQLSYHETAKGFGGGLSNVLADLKEKENGFTRPQRWKSMGYAQRGEDGVYIEMFCNPNADSDGLQAKVLITCKGYLADYPYDTQTFCTAVSGSPMLKKAAYAQALQKDLNSRNRHKRNSFLIGLQSLLLLQPNDAEATEIPQVYGDLASLVEVGVQFIYLGSLLVLLGVGSFLVVRQILFRRELEYAAKELQERVRTGKASPMEYFELGAVMLRKKIYGLATKHLEQAVKKWDGDEQDLAQVYNALGFSYFNDGKLDLAISQYEKAVSLSPGYVTAWNNLGNAYEKKKDWPQAYKAYEQSLQFDPGNKVALSCRDAVKERLERFKGVPLD